MKRQPSIWEKDYYSNGFAVCQVNIINDTTFCRFRNEEFEFLNGGDIDSVILGRGPLVPGDVKRGMLHAKVSKLRKMKHNLIKKVSNG